MSNSSQTLVGAEAAAPKPKSWLERAFGLNGSAPAVSQVRNFDFNALHHSLKLLERKTIPGE